MLTMNSARPQPPRPTIAYVRELTALDFARQREILRAWLAQSESTCASPLAPLTSLVDDCEDFIITGVRDLPKAAASGLSAHQVEAARKMPAWTFAVGAAPIAVVLLLLSHLVRGSAPVPVPSVTAPVATVLAAAPETPSPPAVVAVRPTLTLAPPKTPPPIRAAPTATPVAPMPAVVTTATTAPIPQGNTEMIANSEFGSRK